MTGNLVIVSSIVLCQVFLFLYLSCLNKLIINVYIGIVILVILPVKFCLFSWLFFRDFRCEYNARKRLSPPVRPSMLETTALGAALAAGAALSLWPLEQLPTTATDVFRPQVTEQGGLF